MKNVLDRSISYLNPDFIYKNGEMHHKRRYQNRITLSVWFYGEDLTVQTQKTAIEVVNANAVNLHCRADSIQFSGGPQEWGASL